MLIYVNIQGLIYNAQAYRQTSMWSTIRQRSDYITLVTGPNKSYRNSQGLLR